MKTDFLIIGGGVAGLAAANALIDAGADVTLLEEGTYPFHKICGEFLSPEAVPLLERWGIKPATLISEMKLVMPNHEWSMKLPEVAATIPRYSMDEELARRAERMGAHIKTGAHVSKVDFPEGYGQKYRVTLSTGEQWTAPMVLISAGRLVGKLTNQATPKLCYVGAKAHFSLDEKETGLVMHLMKGAYFGIAPFGNGRFNIAGLIACSEEEARDPKRTLKAFFCRNEAEGLRGKLEGGKCLFDDWMTTPVPEFGVKQIPMWPNAIFLGDAAGVIPPATGNGLAMGLTSGLLAAKYALKGDCEGYRKCWHKEYAGRIARGKLLHQLFLSPRLARAIPLVSRLCPVLPDYCFRATRGVVRKVF